MSTVYFWKPLLNSILMSILASVIAIVYGGIVAFFITRTNMKGKKIISSIFVFPYIMPSWTLATFWQNFWQNPNIGTGRGGMLYNITGLCVPEGFVYGLVPCAVVLGLHYAPFAYILIGGILRNMDANLEEAATMLKASRAKIIYRITLPIVLPALVSTFLLVFASSMSAYAVPQYIGGTMKVLTTYMKSFINSGYYGQGYIMAIVMIVFGVAILLVNQYVTGKRKSFTTVSGKSGQVSYINLSAGKYIVGVVIILISLFCSVLPLITFALESCCVVAGDYSTLTLQYWISSTPTDANNGLVGIFHEKQVWRAFGNSLLLSFLCAIIAGSSGGADRLCGRAQARYTAGTLCRQPRVPALSHAFDGFGRRILDHGVHIRAGKSIHRAGARRLRQVSPVRLAQRHQRDAAALRRDRGGGGHRRRAVVEAHGAHHFPDPEVHLHIRLPAAVHVLYARALALRPALRRFHDAARDPA